MEYAIFVPGHSVVRMPDGTFRPSAIYQDITYPDPGRSFPFRRTGIWNPDCDPDATTSYLGGGEVAVRAAVLLHEQLATAARRVTLYMVGGRSDYLASAADDQTDLSEATVMEGMARGLLGTEASIHTINHTRTTEDDIQAIVDTIEQCGYRYAFVVMMTFRLPRAEVILQRLIAHNPAAEGIASRIVFASAEAFLPDMSTYQRMWCSAAYARTAENERVGIRKILLGQSATTGGKT
jgi:hypothetical protein